MEKPIQLNMKQKVNLETNKHRGFVLALALMIVTVAAILSIGLISISTIEYNYSNSSYKKNQSLNLAEAGVEKAIRELNLDLNYQGTQGTPILLDTGEVEVTVSGTGQSRNVEAVGYIPNKANWKQKKTVKMTLLVSSEHISFNYAVQVGNEGITMYSNSIINGNTYSNGNIVGYANSRINGDAYAAGTISSSRPIVTGTKYPNSPTSEMPTLDYTFWRTAAADGGTQNGNYELNGNCPASKPTVGPQKIIGDFKMNSNTCLIVTGPIYITGNFEMNSNAKLYLDEEFGSTGTVIIVDGTIKLNSNSIIYTTSDSPKGYILLASTNTTDSAVELNSNASQGIIYALNGGVQFNSNAKVVSVVAKHLILNSNATLDYDIGLANADFSGGPGGGWTIQKGTWTEH